MFPEKKILRPRSVLGSFSKEEEEEEEEVQVFVAEGRGEGNKSESLNRLQQP